MGATGLSTSVNAPQTRLVRLEKCKNSFSVDALSRLAKFLGQNIELGMN